MDRELPPHMPVDDDISRLTHSLPPTSSYPPLPLMSNNQDAQLDFEIDWINLFSSSDKIDEQKPSSPKITLSSAARNGGEINTNRAKNKGKGSRFKKAMPPRIAFHTRSADDVLDDGYRWRKYGQKSVKNSSHPRSYYRCTHLTCNVKKQIQRLSKDPSIVVTTYEGIHNHPCEKLLESLSPLLKQLQFLSRI